jgi:cell division inhibitor SepF
MSGAMRKMGVYLGLLEDSERYDDDYDLQDERDTAPAEQGRGGATVAQLAERRRTVPAQPVTAVPRTAELSRITTLHPTTYNEARVIGDRARHQQGVPAVAAQRRGDRGGQAADRRGRLLQPVLTFPDVRALRATT